MRYFYILFFALALQADGIVGYVVDIPSADTITIAQDGKSYNIRLLGVEVMDNFQGSAKNEILMLCLKKNVKIQNHEVDRLGRDVGIVICENVEINRVLIAKGYALTYRKDKNYLKEMRRAQEQKRGMWNRESFVKRYSQNFIQR